MKSPLRILHLEDDAHDAALIQATLEAEGITCVTTCVHTKENFLAALEQGGFDLVLSDFTLPSFDGLSATKLVNARWPELPFILVSGTLGEERAVDALKSGATDYVVKGRLARLAPSVRRAMQEVEARAERKLLEAQFIEGQKMDVIGQLAGGVAHDFNNILGIIIGCNDMIMLKLGEKNPVKKYNDEIRHALSRAVGLTRQLLVFIRKETVLPVVLDLNLVLEDMNQMLRRLIEQNIEMTIVPNPKIGRVLADSGYVGQVLMNLVVNARDAMPKGGKLTIEINNTELDGHYAATHPGVVPGDYVMLSVSDTGTGMTSEVKARLFEAFFTTKPLGKGTGLGLATCRTIVQQSGGYIGVYSELGKGTTFKIYLPRVDKPLHNSQRPFKIASLPRGTETLLLVEDDPAVRHLASAVLEEQGYEVLTANNGQDALQLIEKHEGTAVCLVITDVIMPLMGGKEMAEQLKTMRPDLKLLFTSGYTDDAITRHGVLEVGVEFLPKPYTPASLAGKVREMLDQKVGPR